MTLAEMRSRVRARLAMPSTNAELAAAIDSTINGRYDLVTCERQWWDWLGKSWTLTATAGSARITLPSDVAGVSSVFMDDYGYELPPCNQQVDRIKRGGSPYRQPGISSGWDAFWDDAVAYLEVQPAATTTFTYTVRGIRTHTQLTANTHEPIFPSRFHQMLVEGAVADLAVGDQYDASIAALAEQKYQRFLINMKAFCKMAVPPIKAIPTLFGQFGKG